MAKTKAKRQHGERTASSWLIFVLMAGFLVSVWSPVRWLYTGILGLLAAMATYETMHAVRAKNKLLYGVSMGVSAFMPFVFSYHLPIPARIVLPIYVMLLLIVMVTMNKRTKFVDVLTSLYSSFWLGFGFSCFVLLRDVYIEAPDSFVKWEGFFFVMLAFGLSWGTDGLAYLVGKRFGKKKLAPVISPKKTVEGAVGAVLLAVVGVEVVLALYIIIINKLYDYSCFGSVGNLRYLYAGLLAVFTSVVSIFGDLAASVIKRNFNIKDYGSVFKGHGGIMDRFDSSLFVAPALYAVIEIICR